MIIYFLRHASAGEHFSNPKKDEKRALDKNGIEQCGEVGRTLAALDVQVDVILSSPLKRSAQTASLVGNELSYEGKILFEDGLRPEATFADFRRMLEKYAKYESIMVVGHNPSMTEFLVEMLSGNSSREFIDFKKGAVAKVEKAGDQPAVLKWCLTPKVVRAIQKVSTSSSRPKTASK